MESEKKHGIKETIEVLAAVDMVGLYIISRVKDGVGLDDGMDLMSKILMDDEFKKVVGAAIENIKLVPEEIKDMDVEEGFELAKELMNRGPKFIQALKK